MPITIFSRARLGLSPSVNTVATLTVAVVSVVVVVASVWIAARSEGVHKRCGGVQERRCLNLSSFSSLYWSMNEERRCHPKAAI